jgi:hypothetical protein
MAMPAVEIAAAQGFASRVAAVFVDGGFAMVLVLVVPEVLRLSIAFVSAITRDCGPGELERQKGEQNNGEPTTHAKESISYRVWGQRDGPIQHGASPVMGAHTRNMSATGHRAIGRHVARQTAELPGTFALSITEPAPVAASTASFSMSWCAASEFSSICSSIS